MFKFNDLHSSMVRLSDISSIYIAKKDACVEFPKQYYIGGVVQGRKFAVWYEDGDKCDEDYSRLLKRLGRV